MRIPLSWLREYAPTDLPADDLAELLAHRGVHVEAVLRPWAELQGVIVARVLDVRDHPNSDKLCLARVQTGAGELEVVVGVRNMAAGDLVPIAPPGARVPLLPEPLDAREIRGVVSNGMLCSPRELFLGEDHTGILVLAEGSWEPGTDLKFALGLDDAVLDIEVEPNRPDFLGVYGVAREAAAATGVALLEPDTSLDEGAELAAEAATVEIGDLERCTRYVARVIRGASLGPSPLSARARLVACGVRPLSNAIDATNYAMLELGQPLHGFDLERLAGPGIVVRTAVAGERLETLDGVERELSPEDLLICDVEKPIAIAGVMGGATSEVSEATTDVLLESAHFTRTGVLRTARRLGLHTEASHRFERGTDPEGVDRAAARCAKLMAEWSGGTVLRAIAEAGSTVPRRWVSMRPARAGALLGYPVSTKDAVDVFESLRMTVRVEGDAVHVEVPGYRVDVDREVDLIEEVVRVQGYERVGSAVPRAPHAGSLPPEYSFARRAKEALMRAGLREVRPMSFVSEADLSLTGDTDAIALANPLDASEAWLRTRLTPGLLRVVSRNQARGVRTVGIFEVAQVFRSGEPVDERRKVAIALCGPAAEGWTADGRALDVTDARGALEALLDDLEIEDWSLGDPPAGSLFHPGRSAVVLVGGEPAGVLGELHPRVAESLDITGRAAIFEIEFDALMVAAKKEFVFRDVPRYPPVRRDLAFIVPEMAPAGDVQDALEDAAGDLLDRCVLFDVFSGAPLVDGTKSLAFSVDFRAPDRTLTDVEAEEAVLRIAARLEADFSGQLRAG